MPADPEPYALLERVFREEAGRLTASLVRLLGDFDLAEELMSDALAEALEHWPRDGVPERPASWLLTTARRKGLDRLRREATYREKLALVAALGPETPRAPDDRLHLLFTCCHPILEREAQVALTLRAVVGLTTEEIARAFLVPEETLAKRIVRAKQKIVAAKVPYRVPTVDELMPRLNAGPDRDLPRVQRGLPRHVGQRADSARSGARRGVARDVGDALAARRAGGHRTGGPDPAARGAVAGTSRPRGHLVLLEAQDRGLWDRRAIADAVLLSNGPAPSVGQARFRSRRQSPPSIARPLTWADTDWPQILALYTLLAAIDPSPIVRPQPCHRTRYVEGAAIALSEVETLATSLRRYYLFHATRAALLRELGRTAEAEDAEKEGIGLTKNTAERALMAGRLVGVDMPDENGTA